MDNITLTVSSSLHLMMFDINKNGNTWQPCGFGSGCIVQYRERHFLLSVAHVTDIANASVCIETGQPAVNQTTPVYNVGAMCYFDEYKVAPPILEQGVKELEDLLKDPQGTVDATFCEIKEPITLLQPAMDFGDYQIGAGSKAFLVLDEAGRPEQNREYGFFGWVRQAVGEKTIAYQATLKLGLKYKKTDGRFHIFLAPDIINDADDYRGCSGAPILDDEGKLVGLVCKVHSGTKRVFAFSIDECRRLLDNALTMGML